MPEEHTFLVPDYFPDFHCKMGACRHACCEGWPVSMPMQDYFRLLSEECSPELRRKIDTALHLHKHPSPDEYAFIAPRWDGGCPLRHEDGRCALQMELGEEALTYVCRLYPRGVRSEGVYECSCAASCEKVIELFMSHKGPISFIEYNASFDLPPHAEPDVFDESFEREQAIRMRYINTIQDRRFSLPRRLMNLGMDMEKFARALSVKDPSSVSLLLSEPCQTVTLSDTPIGSDHMKWALAAAEKMVAFAEKHSSGVHEYGKGALEYFRSGSSEADNYQLALRKTEKLLPGWEEVFEHMLVNHMFFERYPFHSGLKDSFDEFAALCGIYGLVRFLVLGWVSAHPYQEEFVDVCAAAFRLIEHTSFDRYASSLLFEAGCDTPEKLYDFIRL